jgi:hypothetical protein
VFSVILMIVEAVLIFMMGMMAVVSVMSNCLFARRRVGLGVSLGVDLTVDLTVVMMPVRDDHGTDEGDPRAREGETDAPSALTLRGMISAKPAARHLVQARDRQQQRT